MAVFRRSNKRHGETQFEGETEAQSIGRDLQEAALALYDRENACAERDLTGAELNAFDDLFLTPFNSGLAKYRAWKDLSEPTLETDAWARWITFRYCLSRLCTEIEVLHDALDLMIVGPDLLPIGEGDQALVRETIDVANMQITSEFGMLRDIGPGLTYPVFSEHHGLEMQARYQEKLERNKERLYDKVERLHRNRRVANDVVQPNHQTGGNATLSDSDHGQDNAAPWRNQNGAFASGDEESLTSVLEGTMSERSALAARQAYERAVAVAEKDREFAREDQLDAGAMALAQSREEVREVEKRAWDKAYADSAKFRGRDRIAIAMAAAKTAHDEFAEVAGGAAGQAYKEAREAIEKAYQESIAASRESYDRAVANLMQPVAHQTKEERTPIDDYRLAAWSLVLEAKEQVLDAGDLEALMFYDGVEMGLVDFRDDMQSVSSLDESGPLGRGHTRAWTLMSVTARNFEMGIDPPAVALPEFSVGDRRFAPGWIEVLETTTSQEGIFDWDSALIFRANEGPELGPRRAIPLSDVTWVRLASASNVSPGVAKARSRILARSIDGNVVYGAIPSRRRPRMEMFGLVGTVARSGDEWLQIFQTAGVKIKR